MNDVMEFLSKNLPPEAELGERVYYSEAEMAFGRDVDALLGNLFTDLEPPEGDVSTMLSIVGQSFSRMTAKIAVMETQARRDAHPNMPAWLLHCASIMEVEQQIFDELLSPYKGEATAGHA